MEWTDIFSGPAFEPVKSRELHLGKDCVRWWCGIPIN